MDKMSAVGDILEDLRHIIQTPHVEGHNLWEDEDSSDVRGMRVVKHAMQSLSRRGPYASWTGQGLQWEPNSLHEGLLLSSIVKPYILNDPCSWGVRFADVAFLNEWTSSLMPIHSLSSNVLHEISRVQILDHDVMSVGVHRYIVSDGSYAVAVFSVNSIDINETFEHTASKCSVNVKSVIGFYCNCLVARIKIPWTFRGHEVELNSNSEILFSTKISVNIDQNQENRPQIKGFPKCVDMLNSWRSFSNNCLERFCFQENINCVVALLRVIASKDHVLLQVSDGNKVTWVVCSQVRYDTICTTKEDTIRSCRMRGGALLLSLKLERVQIPIKVSKEIKKAVNGRDDFNHIYKVKWIDLKSSLMEFSNMKDLDILENLQNIKEEFPIKVGDGAKMLGTLFTHDVFAHVSKHLNTVCFALMSSVSWACLAKMSNFGFVFRGENTFEETSWKNIGQYDKAKVIAACSESFKSTLFVNMNRANCLHAIQNNFNKLNFYFPSKWSSFYHQNTNQIQMFTAPFLEIERKFIKKFNLEFDSSLNVPNFQTTNQHQNDTESDESLGFDSNDEDSEDDFETAIFESFQNFSPDSLCWKLTIGLFQNLDFSTYDFASENVDESMEHIDQNIIKDQVFTLMSLIELRLTEQDGGLHKKNFFANWVGHGMVSSWREMNLLLQTTSPISVGLFRYFENRIAYSIRENYKPDKFRCADAKTIQIEQIHSLDRNDISHFDHKERFHGTFVVMQNQVYRNESQIWNNNYQICFEANGDKKCNFTGKPGQRNKHWKMKTILSLRNTVTKEGLSHDDFMTLWVHDCDRVVPLSIRKRQWTYIDKYITQIRQSKKDQDGCSANFGLIIQATLYSPAICVSNSRLSCYTSFIAESVQVKEVIGNQSDTLYDVFDFETDTLKSNTKSMPVILCHEKWDMGRASQKSAIMDSDGSILYVT